MRRAMFPLGTVLIPGGLLPLHVFEPRYRRMVMDCCSSGEPEFGIVLIERGSEVGGHDIRTDVGTLARILEVGELPDGRFVLTTVGTQRIRITRWLPDDPYPVAEVEPWPDETSPAEAAAAVAAVAQRVRRLAAMALEAGMSAGPVTDDLPDDPILASYHLIDLAPLGSLDRSRLLAVPGAVERLAQLGTALDDVEAALRFRLSEG